MDLGSSSILSPVPRCTVASFISSPETSCQWPRGVYKTRWGCDQHWSSFLASLLRQPSSSLSSSIFVISVCPTSSQVWEHGHSCSGDSSGTDYGDGWRQSRSSYPSRPGQKWHLAWQLRGEHAWPPVGAGETIKPLKNLLIFISRTCWQSILWSFEALKLKSYRWSTCGDFYAYFVPDLNMDCLLWYMPTFSERIVCKCDLSLLSNETG